MRCAAMLCLALAACTPETKPAEAPPATPPAAQSEPAPQPATAATLNMISVDVGSAIQPADGAKVTSPLEITGFAPNDWYFEAVFPLKLLGPDGALVAEAPAQAQSDWTAQGPVMFSSTLTFKVDKETPATLVLEEDMPGQDEKGEDKPPRAVRIPLFLAPPAK